MRMQARIRVMILVPFDIEQEELIPELRDRNGQVIQVGNEARVLDQRTKQVTKKIADLSAKINVTPGIVEDVVVEEVAEA